jgi:hypothetical protein
MISKNQINPKIVSIQTGPSRALKMRKYDFEGFDERNNFLHRNFFRFEVDFE